MKNLTPPRRKMIDCTQRLYEIMGGCTFEEGIQRLREYCTEHFLDLSKVTFDNDGEWDDVGLAICWQIPEPEEQFQKRVKEFERLKAARKKQYDMLKLEFEGQK